MVSHDSDASDAGDGGDVPTVDPADLRDRLRAGERVTLLDVRDRDEVER